MKLSTTDICKSYRGRAVVNGVSVEVNQGEIVGLLGPNGAGKTTSFYMMVGLVKPDSGNVFLDNTDITKFPMYKRAQLGLGYLPQEVSVFRKLSVEDNIMAILEMGPLNKADREAKLETLLDNKKTFRGWAIIIANNIINPIRNNIERLKKLKEIVFDFLFFACWNSWTRVISCLFSSSNLIISSVSTSIPLLESKSLNSFAFK